jgi:serine/threonine protein kinase
MSNGFQLIDALAKYKPSTSVYAGIKTSPTTSNHQHSNLNNNNNNNKNIQTNHQNELYIIKLIDLEDTNELDNDEFKLIQNEIKYAKSLRHRNVVSLLNCFVQHTQIWCIYPYMYYGSLKDILEIINNIDLIDSTHLNNANVDKVDEQKRLCFNEQSLQSVAKSVLSALDYLHSKHIVHRCVCPENIYLSHDGKVYLGGFKYCVNLIENGVYRKLCYDYPSNKSIENYLTYHSPEMLQQVRL